MKQTPCIFCGIEFNNNLEHPLCPDCVADIKLGRARRKEVDAIQAAGELKQVQLGDDWLHPKESLFKTGVSDDKLRKEIMNSILELAGSMSGERAQGTWDGMKYIPNPDSVSISQRWNSFHGDESRSAILPTSRVEALRRFTEQITLLISHEYARGVKYGDSFLSRMARGDVSIDHLNDHNRRYG